MNDNTTNPWSGGEVRGEGLVLRPWMLRDVPQMVELFDTTEMDRWTPLAYPFDEEAATAHVNNAHQGLSSGTLQLAVTESGGEPLGEVLLFGTASSRTRWASSTVGRRWPPAPFGPCCPSPARPATAAADYALLSTTCRANSSHPPPGSRSPMNRCCVVNGRAISYTWLHGVARSCSFTAAPTSALRVRSRCGRERACQPGSAIGGAAWRRCRQPEACRSRRWWCSRMTSPVAGTGRGGRGPPRRARRAGWGGTPAVCRPTPPGALRGRGLGRAHG